VSLKPVERVGSKVTYVPGEIRTDRMRELRRFQRPVCRATVNYFMERGARRLFDSAPMSVRAKGVACCGLCSARSADAHSWWNDPCLERRDELSSRVGAMRHSERHRTHRTGWLRAAVLGANDGIVSTASLVLGSRQQAQALRAFWWRALPGLLLVPCRWLPASMSRSVHKRYERADLARESKNWLQIPSRNMQN